MTSKGIIFDFDGVLADSAPAYVALYRTVAERYRLPYPVADVAEFRYWYNPSWEENYRAMGLRDERLVEAIAYAESIIRYDHVELFEGIDRLIHELAAEYRMAIASTTSARLIEERLERAGLRNYFVTVAGRGADGSRKSGLVARCLAALQLEPSQVIMVGDTSHDVEAARSQGLRCVGAAYGWMAPERLSAASPDRLVLHPGELRTAIAALLEDDRARSANDASRPDRR